MESAPLAFKAHLTKNLNYEVLRMKALEEFNKLKPPLFEGRSDPLAAESWLKLVKAMFDSIGVLPEYRISFATYLFEGLAEDWWDLKGLEINSKKNTWTKFETRFRRIFVYGPDELEMVNRFRKLEQTSNSVEDYRTFFDALCCYDYATLSDPAMKCRRFRNGLRPCIKSQMSQFVIHDFDELVDAAMRVEADQDLRKSAGGSECFLCGLANPNACDCPSRQLKRQSVAQYLNGFVKRYRPSNPITEADRIMMCIRFKQGLQSRIRSMLNLSTIRNFEMLAQAAKNAEAAFNQKYKKSQSPRELKRRYQYQEYKKQIQPQHKHQKQLKRHNWLSSNKVFVWKKPRLQ